MTAPDAGFFERCRDRVARMDPISVHGRVRALVGDVIEAEGLEAGIGSVCRVDTGDRTTSFDAEVIGFRDARFVLMPLAGCRDVSPGARIRPVRACASVRAGDAWLGRVVGGLGEPLDGKPVPAAGTEVPLYRRPESPLARTPVGRPLDVGVRAINGLATVGCGARMGIFAGSGVGKSTLLGQIARHTSADVTVIALVGERGREVREFVERDLGPSLGRCVVVVATSDEPPLLRVRAAYVATALAEHFRSRGRHVLLLMDSLTRFCTALREIGLAAGEPPATRGYPPSMWSRLPRLVERAGNDPRGGSITGVYTVLMEGDDPHEPVVDAARSLLDGHVQLSRELAEGGLFPPVDVLASVSRVMGSVVSQAHADLARNAREALATYRRAEDLISIGAYREGSDAAIDRARRLRGPLHEFIRQGVGQSATLEESEAALALALSDAPAAGSA